jgi:hypothetical protein
MAKQKRRRAESKKTHAGNKEKGSMQKGTEAEHKETMVNHRKTGLCQSTEIEHKETGTEHNETR